MDFFLMKKGRICVPRTSVPRLLRYALSMYCNPAAEESDCRKAGLLYAVMAVSRIQACDRCVEKRRQQRQQFNAPCPNSKLAQQYVVSLIL